MLLSLNGEPNSTAAAHYTRPIFFVPEDTELDKRLPATNMKFSHTPQVHYQLSHAPSTQPSHTQVPYQLSHTPSTLSTESYPKYPTNSVMPQVPYQLSYKPKYPTNSVMPQVPYQLNHSPSTLSTESYSKYPIN
ncbi:hypothetical protein STEG23_022101 [Scotinomys teguina]